MIRPMTIAAALTAAVLLAGCSTAPGRPAADATSHSVAAVYGSASIPVQVTTPAPTTPAPAPTTPAVSPCVRDTLTWLRQGGGADEKAVLDDITGLENAISATAASGSQDATAPRGPRSQPGVPTSTFVAGQQLSPGP
jgi:hypothetical protein